MTEINTTTKRKEMTEKKMTESTKENKKMTVKSVKDYLVNEKNKQKEQD